jgi:hypothetical protein
MYTIFSELSFSGMHRSLAKQDAFITNVKFKVLPINEAPCLAFYRETYKYMLKNLPIM